MEQLGQGLGRDRSRVGLRDRGQAPFDGVGEIALGQAVVPQGAGCLEPVVQRRERLDGGTGTRPSVGIRRAQDCGETGGQQGDRRRVVGENVRQDDRVRLRVGQVVGAPST
jgi:hypothetical protein